MIEMIQISAVISAIGAAVGVAQNLHQRHIDSKNAEIDRLRDEIEQLKSRRCHCADQQCDRRNQPRRSKGKQRRPPKK